MGAKLSLEPILMLVAALSRDILEEFLPFLQRYTDSLVDLLNTGADRDPEILEQIFTSWSYIMMHLQKYLTKDVVNVLKITTRLRYFPKDYVQEFMAETISFVLRNSSVNQLTKGIRKVISEAARSSSSIGKIGATALLWHVSRGVSSRLHSRAANVLQLLMDKSTFSVSDKFNQGSETVLQVVTAVLHRICKEVDQKELDLVYNCLHEEIISCISDGCLVHLSRLLHLLTSTVHHGSKSNAIKSQRMIELVKALVQAYIMPTDTMESEDHYPEVINRVLELMLCLLDPFLDSFDLTIISMLYAPAFKLRNSSVLMFIKGLLQKGPHITHIFKTPIISATNNLVEASPEETIGLILTFFERQGKRQSCEALHGVPEDNIMTLRKFCNDELSYWFKKLRDITANPPSDMQISDSEMAMTWGVLCCYPQVCYRQENIPIVTDIVITLDQLLGNEHDNIATLPKSTWQSLLGAALTAYHKLLLAGKGGFSQVPFFLRLAKRHKSSPQILFAVAEFLDSVLGPLIEADAAPVTFPELDVQDAVDSISIFSDNLGLPDKSIRASTLRILSHYAPLKLEPSTSDEPPCKKLKTEEPGSSNEDSQSINVIELLLSVEKTPVSIATSRKFVILLSRLQMGITTAKIHNGYLPLVLSGIIGILHNRFGHLWKPSLECLSTLISKYKELVWEKFVHYLGNYQLKFLYPDDQLVNSKAEDLLPTSLSDRFDVFLASEIDCTPCMTLTTLLLQALQKIPEIAESRSRQLIPLFFEFLGYTGSDIGSVESFSCHKCKGKEWRSVLKEWLNLLRLMRNARSLYRSKDLKEVMINRLLDEIDPDIQLKVLDCLLNWKDDYLVTYNQHLKNLVTSKNLREELTTWAISKESRIILEDHRNVLIPIIIRILTPRVRKLKALTSHKHGGVNHRRAVLYYLAQLDIDELQLFFSLLLKPLLPSVLEIDVLDRSDHGYSNLSDNSISSILVKRSTLISVAKLSWKKRHGFLRVVEDILRTFDEFHIKTFLNPLLGIVVRLLESCTLNINSEGTRLHNTGGDYSPGDSEMCTSVKQFKDLRSLCLKIISIALDKYDSHDFGSDFWDMFFMSVKPLIISFKQEGSSSERPSSLFSCFVVMSRSRNLVSLLAREETLVPSIFSILSVRTTSEAIISSVLNFVENLLFLDNDSDCIEDDSLKGLLLPHLETLLQSFHGLFRKENHRKSKLGPGKIELRIFKLLVKYISNPLAAGQFLDIVLPLFKKKSIDSDECLEGLCVIKGILPVVSEEATVKVLSAMNMLLDSVGLDLRLSICDILDGLAAKDPSLTFLAKLVRELNAVSSSDIDELDYDTRSGAYNVIRPQLFSQLRVDHAVVVLSHCVYDMSSEELIFRQSASRSLQSFIEFASSILSRDVKDSQEMLSHDRAGLVTKNLVPDTVDNSTTWSNSCIQQIIKRTFLQNMGKAMGKDISIQKEWIALLRDMVYNLHGVASVNSFRPLCSEDAEVDFFNNILHLQIHRRRRALIRFKNLIGAGNFAESITMKVFVPLFYNMLFDVKDGKGEHLRNTCVEALASITGQMKWESYNTFLKKCFREVTLRPDKQRILLRLICAVLDTFHFYDESSSQIFEDAEGEGPNYGNIEGNFSCTLPTTWSASNVPSEIQVYLQKAVLPQIHKLLTSDSEKVNVNVSLTALKLLKLLPVETLESQLPTLVHRICNFLKNRLESIRDEARSAIAACLKELGLEYLQFIVKVLRGILKRGYELHVLGYTLNFILSKTINDSVIGKLDYCLEELLSVAENDIFGEVAEQKEVDKIASKMKETRKSKSFETLKLIAQSVTFRTHALKLLSPINMHLRKHLTPKAKAKLEKMLHHIALGIECNPSLQSTELFIFVYSLIQDSITDKNSITEENSHAKETPMTGDLGVNEKTISEVTNKRDRLSYYVHQSQNSYLVAVFALRVLHNRLKNTKLDKKDEQLLSMLDPFVKLLGDCLNSKYEDVLSAALRCLAPLLKLPLPSLEAQADKIKTLLLEIAQRSGNAGSPLLQSCLKLLTVLLHSTRISLSNDELHVLIQFPLFVDLLNNPSSDALSLLKSIVARKLVVHEIYDVVMQVAELMVTSQSEPIRKKCSKILLQFLLDYRLSDKRLQQHMDFLLSNLSYEHSTGREAVLEMLHAILIKFPKSVVDSQAQTFFLHLVVALANDRDQKVQSLVATAIKELIARTSQNVLHPVLEYSLQWYMGEKQHLWSAAAQVLSLLVEVLKKGFQRHIENTLRVAKGILELSVDASTNQVAVSDNECGIPYWKEAYYTLVLLEKMLIHFPDLYFDKNLEEAWEMVVKLLLHPHMWLRNISARLVALYFAAASETNTVQHERLDLGTMFLCNPRRLFAIAVSFVNQLRTPPVDDAPRNLITQNLVFSIYGLHSFTKQRNWAYCDPSEQGSYLEAFNMFGSRKAKCAFLLYSNDTTRGEQDDTNGHPGPQSMLVVPLLRKMGKLALQTEDIQMRIVFDCFKMISSQIGSEGCQLYAIHMLHPLYKVCEGFAGRVISDEIKHLAEEVRDSIRNVLGVDKFVQVYNVIRKELKEKRDRRKEGQKLTAVVDPMRHAKRKLRAAAKHRAHKKRKITTFKMGKWQR